MSRAKPLQTVEAIPLSVPRLGGNEAEYLRQCIQTNWVSYAGPFVERLESMLAAYVETEAGVATNSGTAAIHIALLVAGIQPGDEVLVSDLTFIAPVNAIRYCGAFPVFMDADPEYGQMDPVKVEEFLERQCVPSQGRLRNRRTGRPVTALLPVHILGHPVPMDPLLELARRFGLRLIEDATEALGARYRGRMVGSLGDLGCFSFNGNKIITTGGGGMIVTRQPSWAARAKHLTTQAKIDPLEYVHDQVGYNYRLTNLQAAVGVAQMEQLPGILIDKRRIAAVYTERFRAVPGLAVPARADWAEPNDWLYTVRIDEARFGVSARELQRSLAARGIQSRPLWAPIHEQVPYRDCEAYRIEVAPLLFRQSLSLPCSSSLTAEQQERVMGAVLAAADTAPSPSPRSLSLI
ncbi:MAG TPA: LegC family aminotransferase [Terriglobales bacterium]|jgi:perosamine synthetase